MTIADPSRFINCAYAFFFFFQAEDGIRDSSVTGVQTCALPISLRQTLESQDIFRSRVPFSCLVRPDSRREGIGPFHGEARFTDLRGIRRRNAGELRSDVIDNVEVAVGAGVVSESAVGSVGFGG